jgi:hypothetical protein
MEVKRLETRQISLRHAGSIEHEVYEGAITDEEVALVQHNPEEFLRRAGISAPPGARIHVSGNRMVGEPANASAVHADARATVGILCRVVIVRVDGYIFIFLYCIPVVIISAQSR